MSKSRTPAFPNKISDGGRDADALSVATFSFVQNDAGDLCEKGIVSPDPDVDARVDSGATLADENTACGNQLTSVTFYPKPLRITVATIS